MCLAGAADGRAYSWEGTQEPFELMEEHLTKDGVLQAAFRSTAGKAAALQALTTQVEQLLWLAHKMQLAPLIGTLHTFIHSSVVMDHGLLRGSLGSVFTPRVQEAALGPGHTTGAQEWINSITSRPAAIAKNPRNYKDRLLKPCSGSEVPDKWTFKAELTRSYLGSPAGTQVDVSVSLEKAYMRIGEVKLPIQLLVGPAACSPADSRRLLGR
jgi:hypothetical protein